MKKRIRSIILRVGTVICSLAIFAEVFSVERCKGIWYQPKEPDGYVVVSNLNSNVVAYGSYWR